MYYHSVNPAERGETERQNRGKGSSRVRVLLDYWRKRVLVGDLTNLRLANSDRTQQVVLYRMPPSTRQSTQACEPAWAVH